ncbi:SDR family NAD(P)-dependent oxidoreductase [Streptomyces lincolnensis]|uniref:SDR family NAD(P)-dependent oxidoreductase n=1 Tax=Streptomyces lincolnensis TaxID=1915 RepID=UPI001E41ED7C|nr:SDR family NAD(P)-dependent oxidoreductase [Streptomyces lincolnensis]MCD7439481.1 SDR family NAD(P)-dependent oxidoreductase [Streptomyces lincolnensis]
MSKIWFITGSSRGLGRQFTKAALERGDKVAATARNTDSLADLVAAHGDAILPLTLDVTDKAAAFAAVRRAHEHFGRLDVVVNSAGYGQFGAIEELTERHARDAMEVNFYGPLWVTQAVLPVMRAQGSGHIVQISSVGGVVAFPFVGSDAAAMWALEGLTDSLAQEVAGFGIKVTLVEPGRFATDWFTSADFPERLPAYEELHAAVDATYDAVSKGDPAAVGPAMLKLVDAENPPLRIFFGDFPLHLVPQAYAERLKTWQEWADVATQAQGEAA